MAKDKDKRELDKKIDELNRNEPDVNKRITEAAKSTKKK